MVRLTSTAGSRWTPGGLTGPVRKLTGMFPSTDPPYRYLRAVRRSRARRIVATGAVLVLPLACSEQDADVFEAGDAAAESAANDAPADSTASSAATTTTGTESTVAAPGESPGTATSADTATVPAGTELVVEFTYAASTTQRAQNPYIAVWVEDTNGELVQTISLWFEQSSKGTKWLRDLSTWYSTSGGDSINSGATRAAGTYSVVWDGTGLDDELVSAGDYVLYIEAAREHGPHSITSAAIVVDGSSVSVTLPDEGELSGATATSTA